MAGIKTLLLTGGEIHDWMACGYEIERTLRESGRFDVTRVNDDLAILESPKVKSFKLIVLYWTRGVLTDSQKSGLLNWIASGKGFAGIHSATASFRECPEYRCMLGGFFVTHPQPRQYQVSVVAPDHPITKDMVEFFVTDEMYVTDYDPRVNVLAWSLWKGEKVPVVWTKPWGNGRVFYLALGHNAEACRDESFEKLLVQGSLWAAGAE